MGHLGKLSHDLLAPDSSVQGRAGPHCAGSFCRHSAPPRAPKFPSLYAGSQALAPCTASPQASRTPPAGDARVRCEKQTQTPCFARWAQVCGRRVTESRRRFGMCFCEFDPSAKGSRDPGCGFGAAPCCHVTVSPPELQALGPQISWKTSDSPTPAPHLNLLEHLFSSINLRG